MLQFQACKKRITYYIYTFTHMNSPWKKNQRYTRTLCLWLLLEQKVDRVAGVRVCTTGCACGCICV